MTQRFQADDVFFTSDTHFFHRGIIDACRRPFRDVEHMNSALLENWNRVVPNHGLVFHLGDVSFGKTVDTFALIGQLNGRIILIEGNHDKKLPVSIRGRFEAVCPFLEIDIEEGGGTCQRISLMHYAMRVWNRHHYGAWHLHGHSHGSLAPIGKAIDVGVDAQDYRPISYWLVKSQMQKRDVHAVDHHRAARE